LGFFGGGSVWGSPMRARLMTPPHRLPLNSLIFRELSGVPSRARGADHEDSDSGAPGANRRTLASARGECGGARATAARGASREISRATRGRSSRGARYPSGERRLRSADFFAPLAGGRCLAI
jgi:hypothetical protein